MTKLSPLDLDALVTIAGRVTLLGQTRDVLPMDGAGYHLLNQLRKSQDVEASAVDVAEQLAYLETAYAIVRRVVPSLSDEEVGRLNEKQVAAVLQVATGQIELVAKQIETAKGNEAAPAKKGRARV